MIFRLWIFWLIPLALIAKEPDALYLSWRKDPATTMTIHWLTSNKDTQCLIESCKDQASDWVQKEGKVLVRSDYKLAIHTVDLSELEPDTLYKFRIKGESEEYTFRTLPQTLSRPVRFAIGGDAFLTIDRYVSMNKQIAKTDPDFVVVGGDLAYTHNYQFHLFNTNKREMERWRTFFKMWQTHMKGADGRLIPILAVVGNHDVQKMKIELHSKKTSLFYNFFAFQEEGVPYRAIDCGDYLSLFLLDTGHRFSVGGQQKEWLEKTLIAKQAIPHKIAAYHIAAYPSIYSFAGETPSNIRRFWVPLFEKYGVKSAFEHHNHAYKRTHPIKAGKMDPKGVVYYGDGSWGASPRKVKYPTSWYIARAESINAFWLITLFQDQYLLESRTIDGKLIEKIKNNALLSNNMADSFSVNR